MVSTVSSPCPEISSHLSAGDLLDEFDCEPLSWAALLIYGASLVLEVCYLDRIFTPIFLDGTPPGHAHTY